MGPYRACLDVYRQELLQKELPKKLKGSRFGSLKVTCRMCCARGSPWGWHGYDGTCHAVKGHSEGLAGYLSESDCSPDAVEQGT